MAFFAPSAHPATSGAAGVVRVGSGLSVDNTGLLSASGAGNLVVPRTPAQAYRPGRIFQTDFSIASLDSQYFTLSNFSYVTDPVTSKPALQATSSATAASILSVQPLRDVEVLFRYRQATDGTYGTSYAPYPMVRYVDDNNRWFVSNNWLTPFAIQGTVFYKGAVSNTTGPTNSGLDTTTYRWMKIRVVGDCLSFKHWNDGATEPDWEMIQRLRVGVDQISVGTCGLRSQFSSAYITHLSVVELVRTDNDLLSNSQFGDVETVAGVPAFWTIPTAPGSGNTTSIVQVADRFGVTRNAVQLARTANDTGSQFIQQGLSSRLHFGPSSSPAWNSGNSTGYEPQVVFPAQAVEVSVWTKGSNVQLSGTTLATAIVTYYYDAQASVLNIPSSGAYYSHLGPNGPNQNAGGDGTWDWYETRFRMWFYGAQRVVTARVDIGFHDPSSTGTLWVMDPQMTPCA